MNTSQSERREARCVICGRTEAYELRLGHVPMDVGICPECQAKVERVARALCMLGEVTDGDWWQYQDDALVALLAAASDRPLTREEIDRISPPERG